jgi:hypothetical protein
MTPRSLCVGAVLVLLAVPVFGQGPPAARNQPASTPPSQPSRLADGQPDVQGDWAPVLGGTFSLTNPMTGGAEFDARATGRVINNPSRIVDPPDGLVPYQPWAAALKKQQEVNFEHTTRPEHIDTQMRCLLSGVPRWYMLGQFQLIQAPGSVVFIWDAYHAYRVIPLDGRPHAGANVKLWMGDGRGHWEGNTLVIDSTNFNGKARLSVVGDFFSSNAHLVERMTFVDANTMTYEVTIDDPTVFTRPWTMRVAERRRPSEEPWESACHEGERSAEGALDANRDKK